MLYLKDKDNWADFNMVSFFRGKFIHQIIYEDGGYSIYESTYRRIPGKIDYIKVPEIKNTKCIRKGLKRNDLFSFYKNDLKENIIRDLNKLFSLEEK